VAALGNVGLQALHGVGQAAGLRLGQAAAVAVILEHLAACLHIGQLQALEGPVIYNKRVFTKNKQFLIF